MRSLAVAWGLDFGFQTEIGVTGRVLNESSPHYRLATPMLC
jgi:hypothetical protein